MPKLNRSRWVNLIAAHPTYRGDLRKLGAAADIPYGTLRNAVHGHDEMRLGRIYAVADALGIPHDNVPGLLAAGDELAEAS